MKKKTLIYEFSTHLQKPSETTLFFFAFFKIKNNKLKSFYKQTTLKIY